MSWNYSVLLNDPTNIGGSSDGILVYDLQQALGVWSQYVLGIGNLVVQLNITTGGVRESGGATTSALVGTNGQGLAVYEPSSQYELTTGTHVGGATSDITINVDSSYFQSLDLVSGLSYGSQVPSNEYNPVVVFMHELMHGFGMAGWYSASGTLPGNYESTFDQLITKTATGAYFTGAAAEAAYGGAVPQTTNSTAGENYYHFGNQQSDRAQTPSTVQDPLTLDLMNGIVLFYDFQYPVSALDLGVLKDLGYSIRTTPVVTASNVTAAHGQSFAASSLFSISIATGDSITEYALWDSSGNGHWVVNGVAQGTNTEIDISAAQLAQTSYQSGSGADQLWITAYDGVYWSTWKPFTVTAPVDSAATVTVSNVTGARGQTSVGASGMFAASDADGDTVTKYALWDSNGNGHWVVNGVAQGTNAEIDISAAQLAQTTYQFGSASDQLWVQVYDGYVWSAWKPFTASPFVDTPAVVTTSDFTATHGQNIAATSLFSASDPDGDTATSYQLWDSSGASAGYWMVGGVQQGGNVAIDVTAAQLGSTTFQSGSGSADLWARAYDGTQWGPWKEFHVNAPVDQGPVVAANNVFAVRSQTSVGASGMFAASDADGDTVTKYALWDSNGNGHWVVNGVAQGTNAEIDISAAQLAQTTYQFGSATDQLWVRAYDGFVWGAWKPFNASPFVDTPAVVTASDFVATHGQNIAASSLFSASDPDGDTVTSYQLWDSFSVPASYSYWVVGGVQQNADVAINVTAAQLASTTFQSGSGTSDLWARAYDGTQWGAWKEFHVIAPLDAGPVITAADVTVTHGQSIAASSLFAAVDGDPVTMYMVSNDSDPTTGYWHLVRGTQVLDTPGATITPDVQATFISGSGSADIEVRAFDGVVWGAWKEFHVNAPVDQAAVVTASDVTATHGQNIAATSLFSAADADGDAITSYQIWSDADASHGTWKVGGAAQQAATNITITASQLSSTTFQSGSGSADLWVRANDGFVWGPWKEFHVNAPTDQPPVVTASDVTATHDQNIAASSLFSATDPEGDAITSYQVWDSSDPSAGHWVVGGVAQGSDAAINVTAAQLPSSTFQSGSGSADLWVRANDGFAWGPWKEFHVNAPLDQAPVVTGSNFAATANETVVASSLFSAADADGDVVTAFQLWDTAPAGGHWTVNGTAQAANVAINVTASQLPSTTFSGGTASDDLWVRAFDGTVWGQWHEFHWVVSA